MGWRKRIVLYVASSAPASPCAISHTFVQFRQYLEDNGFDTSAMGLPEYQSETSSVEVDEKKSSEKVETIAVV
jgi:hypothetical protein